MRRFFIGRRRRERGQALTEFAVVGLVFFLLVFGMIDVGRAVWNYNTLSQATREGGRYAIVHGEFSDDPSGPGSPYFTAPDSDSKVTETVERFASGLDPARLAVSAEWLDGDNSFDNRVKVKSEYTYQPIFSFWGGLSFTMSSSTTMKITY